MPTSDSKNVFVIGTGPAGYGAAKHLMENGQQTRLLEKNSYFGGHCASFEFEEGFVFDDGPHISFTKHDEIKELFAANTGNDVSQFSAYVDNWWRGYWVKHPAITSMHGLPAEMNTKILMEITAGLAARGAFENSNPDSPNAAGPAGKGTGGEHPSTESTADSSDDVKNYEEWLIRSYGDTYARNFPMEYTVKYHTTEAKNLTTDWLGPRLYQPDLEEVIQGMLSAETPDRHYISEFRYPNKKGFANFVSEVQTVAPVSYESEVTEIDVINRTFTINGSETHDYDHLVSSMPLPTIMKCIKGAPADLIQAAEGLACTQAAIVNFGVKRPEISKAHWSYFYDEEIPFARTSFPHKFSPHTVPEGCSAVQAETYFSDKYRPMTGTLDQVVEETIEGLLKVGTLKSRDEIVFSKAWIAPWAQVIFDHDRKEAVDAIHGFLRENNIEYCGRFGEWAYIWSDESYLSGRAAADRIIQT